MLTETAAALGTTWVVDPDRSTLCFTIAHLKVATVKGRFGTFDGALRADESGSLRAAGGVDAATLSTGNAIRDRRLRGPEFFDSDRHPEIRFASRWIAPLAGGELQIVGDLTIRGTARQVELRGLTVTSTTDRLELLVTGTLSRKDFGIDSIELNAAGVADAVTVVATLSLSRDGRT